MQVNQSIKMFATIGFALCFGAFVGCKEHAHDEKGTHTHADGTVHSNDHKHTGETTKKDDHGHGHVHKAPHGGTLVAIGDHFAHLELTLDQKAGRLTLYVLDGEAEKPVRLKQGEIELFASPIAGKGEAAITVAHQLKLTPVPSNLTGEKVGDSSQFEVVSDHLKTMPKFSVVITQINIFGKEIKNTGFNFPEGKDMHDDGHKHGDDHDHKHGDDHDHKHETK